MHKAANSSINRQDSPWQIGSSLSTVMPASRALKMPRVFSLDPQEYQTPSIAELRWEWRRVPDVDARNMVAVEAQYLDFHRYLLNSLRHRSQEGGNAIPVGLSVRAGAIKTASLICASIAEAVLRSHAERRGYELPNNPRHRTFGKVLGAWQLPDETPKPDVEAIWTTLQALHYGRNNIHLYHAVEAAENFYELLEAESHLLADADHALEVVKHLESA